MSVAGGTAVASAAGPVTVAEALAAGSGAPLCHVGFSPPVHPAPTAKATASAPTASIRVTRGCVVRDQRLRLLSMIPSQSRTDLARFRVQCHRCEKTSHGNHWTQRVK